MLLFWFMHSMAHHIPEFLWSHKWNIVQFTQQGLEKLNDISTKTFRGHQTTRTMKHWSKCFRKWIELNCSVIKAMNKTSCNRNSVYARTLHTTKEPARTETVKTNINHIFLSLCIHEHNLVYIIIYNIPLEMVIIFTYSHLNNLLPPDQAIQSITLWDGRTKFVYKWCGSVNTPLNIVTP